MNISNSSNNNPFPSSVAGSPFDSPLFSPDPEVLEALGLSFGGGLSSAPAPHGGGSPPRRNGGGSGAPPRVEPGRAGAGGATEARARLYPDYRANNLSSTLHFCPGHNLEPSSATCGTFHHAIICRSNQDHYNREIPHTCGKPGCPECWRTWAGRATKRATGRVQGYVTATRTKYRPRHVIWSPRPKDYQDADAACQELLEDFHRLWTRSGAAALALVVHPYRFRGGMREKARDEARDAGFRGNPYEWVLSRDAWADYLYISPHIHALVLGYLVPSDDFEKETGWIYKNRGVRTSIEGTLFYLLTHAWVRGNAAAVRYWGGMSTRHLGCTVRVEHVTKACPVCHEDLGRVGRGEDYQDLHNAPTAWFVLAVRDYWIRKKARGPPGWCT